MKKSTSKVNFFSSILKRLAPTKRSADKTYRYLAGQISKRPLITFAVLLLSLFLLLVLSKYITKPKELEKTTQNQIKEVATFNIGVAPTIRIQAQVEKSGVIQIVAQAPGIVSKINVKEGKNVNRGTNLLSLASNYQGTSAASVQKQLAYTQYANTKNNFDLQKDIIAKQRELANKQDSNADGLRDITSKSAEDTRNLIALNDSVLSTLDQNLKTLIDNNTGGVNDTLILQTKQLQSQLLSGNNQAKSALRQAEFQQDSGKPPAEISNLQRELTQKQLDLQEKSLQLGLDTAALQLRLAQINESIMFPVSPFAGSVQRVHVKVGQSVSPGTLLVTIVGTNNTLSAVALVPQNIAKGISKLQNSYLIIDGEKIEQNPIFISQEATNGQLYSVIFTVPQEHADKLTNLGYIEAEVPIGYNYTNTSTPFIPLDAVHQTQNKAIVYVADGDTAKGKEITLGQVQSSFVEITTGLKKDDIVILDRTVVSGDKVKLKSPEQ